MGETAAQFQSVQRARRRHAALFAATLAALPLAAAVLAQPAPAPAAAPAPAPSLLPDAFRTAPQRPAPTSAEAPAPLPGTQQPAPAQQGNPEQAALPGTAPEPADPLLTDPTTQTEPDPFADAPLQTARRIGLYPPGWRGWTDNAFAASNGRFVYGLMRRIQAPIASRWASITLRNALLTQASAPQSISTGDWVAARAGLLTRWGEIDGARALIDAMPLEANTAAATRVAGQAAMAAADIGALCPIARTGRQRSRDTLWELALGMCAALEGDDISAAALFDSLRNRSTGISPFDLRLAEGIAAAAGSGGRASNIGWSAAPPLTPYRFGVATALGVAIPDDALAALGPARHGWIVRQPGIVAAQRLAAFGPAAVLGTVSATEYVAAVSALAPDGEADTPAALLRAAFAGVGAARRVDAMKAIWNTPVPGLSQEAARYAGFILTAPAAARLPISDDVEDDSADIIASLLAGGYSATARRWWPIAQQAGGLTQARAWALLAASGAVSATPDAFEDWRDQTGVGDAAAARLLAALMGLGATSEGNWPDELVSTSETSWSRAIASAAAAGSRGEVMVLTATGLQGTWRDVPPMHLRAITAALVRTGQRSTASRIAAEAVTRG
jgi:hypothetical protein